MAFFKDMDVVIADLKMRIQVLNDQMRYIATTITYFAATASFFVDKEREKKTLEAQLHDIEKSHWYKQPSPISSQCEPAFHQAIPASSGPHTTGIINPGSIDLWEEPPPRRLPPWLEKQQMMALSPPMFRPRKQMNYPRPGPPGDQRFMSQAFYHKKI